MYIDNGFLKTCPRFWPMVYMPSVKVSMWSRNSNRRNASKCSVGIKSFKNTMQVRKWVPVDFQCVCMS